MMSGGTDVELDDECKTSTFLFRDQIVTTSFPVNKLSREIFETPKIIT